MTHLLKPGKYVVAVSGGVDSVALLNMLAVGKNLELVVAYFDHGVRGDSAEDAKFVRGIANKLDLEFVSEREELGSDASEALARMRRYEFLNRVREDFKARAIVTAHHQDDLIETALLNVLRGTKRRGLVSLKSTETLKRPLLNMPKQEIKDYANQLDLKWREDSTNNELRYKRNQIRALISESLTPNKRRKIVELLNTVDKQNKQIEKIINEYLSEQPPSILIKSRLLEFSSPEASEIIAIWLRSNEVAFDAKAIGRILNGAQNLQNGAQIDVQQDYYCLLTKDQIILKRR